jgi:hypothetical protein
VALVAADLRLSGRGGVEFLRRARARQPGAGGSCWWPWTGIARGVPSTKLVPPQRATALGLTDFAVVKGWVTPEDGTPNTPP